MIDNQSFKKDLISRETLEFNKSIHQQLSSLPPTYKSAPQKIREATEAGAGLYPVKAHAKVEERLIPGPGGSVPIRIFIPDQVRGVYLHFHGGGFMLGRAYHQDVPLVRLAQECHIATVSVDYRLAPENPYPAGPDDCEAAALWLLENCDAEFGAGKILIGGESAGANLAVVTLVRMRDKHQFAGFIGANLVYGVYDVGMTPSALTWGEERNYLITTRVMDWFAENYTAGKSRKNPDISPLFADLTDLPLALFTVGTLDPLLDDSLFMHSRWQSAGNPSELAVYPGGIHAFNAFPIQLAHQANARIAEFTKGIFDSFS